MARPSTTRSRRTGATRSCSSLVVIALLRRARLRDRLRASTGSAGRRRRASRRSPLVARRRCSAVGSYFGGDKLVLAASRREGGRRGVGAAAHERRPGDGDRGERADAQGLHHRRHGAERLRDRPRPEARVGRDHDAACSRSSTARSSRASSATSCRTSATSTSGSRSSSASWSARSRSSPTSSCASRSGAAAGRAQQRPRQRRQRRSRRSSSSSRSSWRSSPRSSARFVQLAVSRQREYLADASSVELTRNPYGLERALAKIADRPGGPRGRQPGDPAHVLHEPDQEVRGALVAA